MCATRSLCWRQWPQPALARACSFNGTETIPCTSQLIACSLFEHQIPIFDAGEPPPRPTVAPLSARAWPSRQPPARTARVVEDLNGSLEKSLSDPAPFIGLFYEQCKEVTAAWISGGKANDLLILNPNKEARVVDIPANVLDCERARDCAAYSRARRARISMIWGMSSRGSRDPQCEASEGPFEAIGGSHRPQAVRVQFAGSPVWDHCVGGRAIRLPCCQRRAPPMRKGHVDATLLLNPSH